MPQPIQNNSIDPRGREDIVLTKKKSKVFGTICWSNMRISARLLALQDRFICPPVRCMYVVLHGGSVSR